MIENLILDFLRFGQFARLVSSIILLIIVFKELRKGRNGITKSIFLITLGNVINSSMSIYSPGPTNVLWYLVFGTGAWLMAWGFIWAIEIMLENKGHKDAGPD